MFTRKTALQHILKEYNTKRLGATTNTWWPKCVYEAPGDQRHCAVGALFSPAQLADLKTRGINSSGITEVISVIGKNNIETVTGMKSAELVKLQSLHDINWPEVKLGKPGTALHSYLTAQLAKL